MYSLTLFAMPGLVFDQQRDLFETVRVAGCCTRQRCQGPHARTTCRPCSKRLQRNAHGRSAKQVSIGARCGLTSAPSSISCAVTLSEPSQPSQQVCSESFSMPLVSWKLGHCHGCLTVARHSQWRLKARWQPGHVPSGAAKGKRRWW